jgi:hypothetical protein
MKRSFGRLMANFTWWVNRKDRFGRNVFEGGFLGLDNIGVFDRSAPLPTGGHLEQADGTAWMSLFCQNMLEIGVEIAAQDPAYEDLAVKFGEHFLWIALTRIFLRDASGGRPVHGGSEKFQTDPNGAITCCSTSISTVTTAPASARAIRSDRLDGAGGQPDRAVRPPRRRALSRTRPARRSPGIEAGRRAMLVD